MRRYFQTFLSTLLVWGVYTAYAQVSSQFLSRERVVRTQTSLQPVATPVLPGPRVSQEMVQKHLADVPWTAESRVKIHIDGLHLFFNERTQENAGTEIRVSPVAMVWSPAVEKSETIEQTSPDKKPLVILADSATFQFDAPVELSEIQTKLIRQIMLRGRVVIRGEDGLQISGSNFTFSRAGQHLFSDFPIEFRMQENRGFARNIQINLDILDGGVHQNNPRILGINELVIREHVELHLQAEKKPPVLVTCEERLQYRVKQQQAMLLGDVYVNQVDAAGFTAEISCERLTLQLEKAEAEVARSDILAPVTEKKPELESASGLNLRSLLAEGKRVRCRSQAEQLYVEGQSLLYDLRERRILIKDQQKLQVRYQGADLVSPELEMHLDAEDQPIYVRCAGPGQLQYREQNADNSAVSIPGTKILEAQWRDHLVMEPDPEQSQGQQVTLSGLARLTAPPQKAGLIANTLKFWLAPNAQSPPAAAQTKGISRAEMSGQLQIRKIQADEQVAIASEQLEGVYESLLIEFQAVPASRLLAYEAGEKSNPLQLTSAEKPAARNSQPRLKVDARQLQLQVLHDETFQKFQLSRVKTDGEMQALALFPQRAEAVEVSGQKAEIENGPQQQQKFQLLGNANQFAWIRNGLMRIDGIDLFVDRGANLARVRGSGSLQFPVNSNWEGMELGSAQLMQVSWQEQMTFDGQEARFVGNVRASIGDSVITCQQLNVQIDQRISLDQPESASKPRILLVDCQDQVRLEMNQFEEAKLVGVRHVHVSTYQMNHQTGQIRAQGPGKMEFWQKRNGNSPLGLPEGTMQQGPGQEQPAATGWDYTQVLFAGHMSGQLQQQQGTLHDRVNVLHGPVDRPLASFERDDRPANSVWMRCERLEILVKKRRPRAANNDQQAQLAGATRAPSPYAIEIQARENAEIEGDKFLSRADVITYDQENELFVMRAIENRHATIWHFDQAQQNRARYDVKMIRLSPNGNLLELDRTLGASGIQ